MFRDDMKTGAIIGAVLMGETKTCASGKVYVPNLANAHED